MKLCLRFPSLAVALALASGCIENPVATTVSPMKFGVALEDAEASAAADFAAVKAGVEKAGLFDEKDLFMSIDAVEPSKTDTKSGKWPRVARFEILRKPELKVVVGTFDLEKASVIESREVMDVEPWLTDGELLEDIQRVALADKGVQDELERRGIPRADQERRVRVDPWATGARSPASKHGQRLARCLFFEKSSEGTYYTHPIEGVTALVDLASETVLSIEKDPNLYPVSSRARLLSSEVARAGALRPIESRMPEGVSFTADGNNLSWWKWKMRWSFNAREGLVIHGATFDDADGKPHDVLGRGSISEIAVPYSPSSPTWGWRCAMDEGEYGLGRCSTPLTPGRAIPGYAKTFNCVIADEFGEAAIKEHAVAIYERARGPLWMHNEEWPAETGYAVTPMEQDRELVVCTISTVGNYDYLFEWSFSLSGAVHLRVSLHGILLSCGTGDKSCVECREPAAAGDTLLSRHIVEPNIDAPLHQHLFSVRLDLDVDGEKNSVTEEGGGGADPGKSYYSWSRRTLKTEKDSVREPGASPAFGWRVENSGKTTALGHHPSYRILPHSHGKPVIAAGDPFVEKAWFARHALAVTRLDPAQLYSCGDYVLSESPGGTLETWVADDQPIAGEDVVCWVTLSAVHLPCAEQWPIMAPVTVGVDLVPDDFLSESPTVR
ncbi:MAG: primary-amine [Planctomycetota bacterium]|nr:MAG: primary-amine [Planctomycetota bacterium]